MQSKATTVERYLAELPPDRREAIQAVREVILENLGKGFEEGMQYGMIGYYVPHAVYPPGYHCDPKRPLPFASLGSQKNHMAVYLCNVYSSEADAEWFRGAWAKTGKKLDMGKSCVRFKKLEDVALDVIGKSIKRTPATKFIAEYESALAAPRTGPKQAGKKSAKKKATKKPAPKKKAAATKAPAKKKSAKKRSAKKTTRKVAKKR